MAGAVVGARFGNVNSGNETSSQIVIGSWAVSILLACSGVKGSLSAGSTRGAPTTENVVASSKVQAVLATCRIEICAFLLLLNGYVASRSLVVRGTIGAVEAKARASGIGGARKAGSMSTAEVAIIVAWLAGDHACTAGEGIESASSVGVANTGSVLTLANAISATVLVTLEDLTLAIASNGEALSVLLASNGDKSSRVVVDGICLQLADRDLDQVVEVIACSTRGEAEPRVRRRGENSVVALASSASGSGEPSDACRRRNDATLADISTLPGLVTIMHSELEAVAVRRIEGQEIEVPHDFSTPGIDGGLGVCGIDKSNGERIRTNAKVPACAGSVPVLRRVGFSNNVEGVRIGGGVMRDNRLVD